MLGCDDVRIENNFPSSQVLIERVRCVFFSFFFFIFQKCIDSEILKNSKFIIDVILSFPLVTLQ